MKNLRISDPTNRAYEAARDRALHGVDLKAARDEVARATIALLPDGYNAQGPEARVATLRHIGGWSALILGAIDKTYPDVDPQATRFEIPTSTGWWVRTYLINGAGDEIRNRVVAILDAERKGKADVRFGRLVRPEINDGDAEGSVYANGREIGTVQKEVTDIGATERTFVASAYVAEIDWNGCNWTIAATISRRSWQGSSKGSHETARAAHKAVKDAVRSIIKGDFVPETARSQGLDVETRFFDEA